MIESIKKLTDEFNAYCNKIGIDIIGFSDPTKFNKFDKEYKPDSYLKKSKTVIVIGFHLYDLSLDAWSKDEKKEKSYHFTDSILVNQCHQIKSFLAKRGFKSKIISYEPGLYLKDAAVLAGIGPIGKNNLIITKKFGSQVRLRALVTEAELWYGTPIHESVYCRYCNICVDSCPAGALERGKYNKDLCRNYCLANLKYISENTVIWCNKCIESCPVGKTKN
ncbi:MAG: epoxyqueuosine reductase [Candidatus Lokiarchaeota archaeon]|nr:epoxyqueuosine reductase [Candidatus Lokiarchaeota archaeon]